MKKSRSALIFSAAMLCAAMLLTSCSSSEETKNGGDGDALVNPNAEGTVDAVTEAPVREEETEAPEVTVPEDYIDRITFLGDSTTYGLRYYEVLEGGKDTTQVWTPSSGTLSMYSLSAATIVYPETDEQLTIREALTRKQPEYLVITLGVNGIAAIKEAPFKAAYKSVITTANEVSPDTKIICQSMYPVASNYDKLDSINNDKISAGNEWIKAVANEMGVHYVDTYSVLIGDDGWLPQEYTNGDGLHLSPEGFEVVIENLKANPYIG